ncbi:pleckstrin homology domain-containing family S member 1-like [Sinocyclocheilus grahami]|uniref:pleckstrin homology domain-containing family S member 1-like n=1 Tax=Sinocyclocheilus grahami TaxID=75366 RepID=UPI0007AC728E|nr:PREDICTED: pleckstrin homology domain-containing family S member 1-like [Sinocyclocheilus grahami]
MSNNKKSPTTAKFYSEPAVEELYTGYLVKSPPLTALTKNTKSWKNRFFVLSKIGEDTYQLTYHVNERRGKPLGAIDISKISLLFTSPETHQKWDWVKKQSKGSPSSVLFLKVEDVTLKQSREYFLIGKDSADVDGWLNAFYKAMKIQKSQNKLPHTDDTQDKRSRAMTLPMNYSEPNGEDQPDDRWSAFEITSLPQYNHYDYPRKLSEPPIPISVIEEKDEMDGKQDEPPEDNSEYMSMGSVQRVKDDQQEDDMACKEKNEVHRHSNQSLVDFTENCASTESDNSEMQTHVEKELCGSQNDLTNSLILTQEGDKPCMSECHQIQDLRGNQTLPPDTVQEIQKCIKKLSKDEVKLLIRRLPDLTLNTAHHTEDTKQSLMQNLSSLLK